LSDGRDARPAICLEEAVEDLDQFVSVAGGKKQERKKADWHRTHEKAKHVTKKSREGQKWTI